VNITNTAHPGAALAAIEMGAEVYVCHRAVNAHSLAHGEHLIKSLFFSKFWREIASRGTSLKRLRAKDLRFVELVAPSDHDVPFSQIAPDPSSDWRAGVDRALEGSTLAAGMLDLLSKNLGPDNITTRADPNARLHERVLVASRGFKYGEKIGDIHACLFSSPEAVREFAQAPGCDAILQGPIFRISGICDDIGSHDGVIYAAPVGPFRYARDSNRVEDQKTKRANCKIRVNPGAGPNDGFLELVSHGRTHLGIAASSELCVDLGAYVPLNLLDPEGRDAKRFKGALDAFFQTPAANASTAEDTADGTDSQMPPAPPAPPAPPDHGSASGAGHADLQWSVQLSESEFLFTFIHAKTTLTVGLPQGATGNKKVSPKSLLYQWDTGGVDVAPGTSLPSYRFKFTSPSALVALRNGATITVRSLKDTIAATQATSLWKHGRFPSGEAPTTLTCTDERAGYLPDQASKASFEAIRDLVASKPSAKVCLTWMLNVDNKKLIPAGVCLTNAKQLIVKPEGVSLVE